MFTVKELIRATGGTLAASGKQWVVRTIATDTREICKDEAFLAIRGVNFDGHDFIQQAFAKGVRCIICDRPLLMRRLPDTTVIRVPDTIAALGHIARFNRMRFDIPVIAVTGSNGKTTTKDMLAWILSAGHAVLKNEGTKNNHIGVPGTLLQLNASHSCAVIELGTNHPGEISYLSSICEPTMALITNVGPSHLEYFKDLPGVYREKASILRRLRAPAIGILNADDPFLRKRLACSGKRLFLTGFGINNACDFQARDIRRDKSGFSFAMHRLGRISLSTPGECNIYNALAALCACRILGIDYATAAARLKKFAFPKGRLMMRDVGDVRFIDDSYNANPCSMAQAMDALRVSDPASRRVLVMGDMLELGCRAESFHRDAGKDAARSCDVFITVGKHSLAAAAAAVSKGFDKANIFSCKTAAQARDVLYRTVSVGKDDIVLLKGSRGMRLEQILDPL